MKFERLDRRIKLQRLDYSATDPDSGEAIEVVLEEVPVYAEFRGLIGAERTGPMRELVMGYSSFIIRYRSGIDAQGWRVKDWQERIWDIQGEPVLIGRRDGLELFCVLRDY